MYFKPRTVIIRRGRVCSRCSPLADVGAAVGSGRRAKGCSGHLGRAWQRPGERQGVQGKDQDSCLFSLQSFRWSLLDIYIYKSFRWSLLDIFLYIYINLIFYFYCVLNVERQNAEGHLGRDGEIGIQPETSSHCCWAARLNKAVWHR